MAFLASGLFITNRATPEKKKGRKEEIIYSHNCYYKMVDILQE